MARKLPILVLLAFVALAGSVVGLDSNLQIIEGVSWSKLTIDDAVRVYQRPDEARSVGYLAVDLRQHRARYWNE